MLAPSAGVVLHVARGGRRTAAHARQAGAAVGGGSARRSAPDLGTSSSTRRPPNRRSIRSMPAESDAEDWPAHLPTPARRLRSRDAITDELAQQLRMLDLLFQDAGLVLLRHRSPRHPAVVMYDLLRGLEGDSSGVAYESHDLVAQALARMMLDRSTWAPGVINSDFLERAVPDSASRVMIRSRIIDQTQYGDVMAELYCWGWMRSNGWTADLVEDEGAPDITVLAPHATYAEVKHIQVGTNAARIDKVTKKANKQIKTVAGDNSGLLFVFVDRLGGRAAFDDRVPNDVLPYVEAVRRRMRSKECRSVGATVVVWDDAMTLTDKPEFLTTFVRRRSVTVLHEHARTPLPTSVLEPELGATVVVPIRFSGSPPSRLPPHEAPGVIVTQVFRAINEFEYGLLPTHVTEILAEPDAAVTVTVGGIAFQLVARRLTRAGRSPSVAVVLAWERTPGQIEVYSALQLFGSAAELQSYSEQPLAAFREALNRYGVPVTVGGTTSLLVESVSIPGAPSVSLGRPTEQAIVSAFVTQAKTPFGAVTHVTWAHAIDREAYRGAVRAGRAT